MERKEYMAERVSSRLKHFSYNLCVLLLGVTVILIVLEVGSRMLPVCDAYLWQPVDNNNPIGRFKPENKHITCSLGWNFYQIAKKRINNEGFFNNLDYVRNPDRPVVAVIGDSFVEALQVDNEETFFGILQGNTNKYYFYSFGSSGSQLPTYIAYARYAMKYNPRKMVFVIVDNDFNESFYSFKKAPGYWYFNENGSLYLVPYSPENSLTLKIKRWFASHSAFLRYLYINVGLPIAIKKVKNNLSVFARKVKGIVISESHTLTAKRQSRRKPPYKQAVDLFFEHLSNIPLASDNIIFVVDAPRWYIYNNRVQDAGKSYFGIMRNYFIKVAKRKGYRVVDMLPIFADHYIRYGKKFEFPTDPHWNELGHRVVAEALKEFF